MEAQYTTWFTLSEGTCIGIVVGKDDRTGKSKAYIGRGAGLDPFDDVQHILDYGVKFSRSVAEELVKLLENEGE